MQVGAFFRAASAGRWLFLGLIAVGIWSGCQNDTTPIPRPRGFPKVVYPEKNYRAFDKDYCSFTFEYPGYANIEQDTSFFNEKPAHPCWFDIYTPAFDSRLHCSYFPIRNSADLEKLKKDAFELVDYHKKRANSIDEIPIGKEGHVSGFLFDIRGPAASPLQFYLTDSTHHFIRGALYFNTQARPDSLAPVYEFVKADVIKMLETFEWR